MEEQLKLPSTTYWRGGLSYNKLLSPHPYPACVFTREKGSCDGPDMLPASVLLSCSAALQPHAAPASSPVLG